MNGFAAPAGATTGDGRRYGVGSRVYGLAEDGVSVLDGDVLALVYDTPLDPAAGWAVVNTFPPRQWRAGEVFADRAECVRAAAALHRRRMLAADRERERSLTLYQKVGGAA